MPTFPSYGAEVTTECPGPLSCAESLSAPPRVIIDLRGLGAAPVAAMRLLIVADVLRRVLEHPANSAISVVAIDDGCGRSSLPKLVARGLSLLNTDHCRSDGAGLAHLGGSPTVVVTSTDRAPAGTVNCRVLPVGGVKPMQWDADLSRRVDERDPLNLRLALLHFPYAAPAALSAARLHRADATLIRWRFKVSYWKDQPDAPARDLEALDALLANDLDTGSVLRAMHRIEIDHTIPSGAKFQTFVALDRVLALDLRRSCGHGHW
ncbi:hypothetical protein [Leekyejoonella antrihumi]|uniref:Uncharacterized protein n=1 Tax=Leekyejoonella antrihumi TaxID=1660198 RepID=A0A563E7E4_9MICO|nr:hypothetical protein [Leekyejoonella antrihumi]TWP38345.1 hypothetical protein FGL98_03815 [Leekyejoonella antrihumi]